MDSAEKAFSFNRTAIYVAILFCAGLALNLGTQALFPEHRTPDSLTYIEPARDLLAHGKFVSHLRTPGYPIFLSLIYLVSDSDLAVVWAQKVLLLLTVITSYMCFRCVFGHRPAFLAALLVLCNVPSLLMANYILTETLFTLWLLVAFILVYEGGQRNSPAMILASAFLLGLLVLIRPIGIAVFAAFALYLATTQPLRRRQAVVVLVFVIVANLAPLSWSIRQKAISGVWGLTTMAGVNSLYYQACAVLTAATGADERHVLTGLEENVRTKAQETEKRLGRTLNPYEVGRIEEKMGREIILSHPGTSFRVWMQGVRRNLLGPGYPNPITFFGPTVQKAIHVGQYALTTLSLLLFLIGAAVTFREPKRRSFVVLACLTIASLIALPWGREAHCRFRVPIMPYYCMLVTVGVCGIARFIRGKHSDPAQASCSARWPPSIVGPPAAGDQVERMADKPEEGATSNKKPRDKSFMRRNAWVVFLALYLVVPWIIVKALAGCALLASLGRMRRWSRPSVATALGLLFGLAYIVSPYWALPRYYVNHPLAMAMGPNCFAAVLAFGLLIIGAAWAWCSSGPIQWTNGSFGPCLPPQAPGGNSHPAKTRAVPFMTPRQIAPAILAALIIALSYAPICGALALDGDESFHIVRTRILGRALIQLAGKSLPSLSLSLLAAAAFLMWPGRPSRWLRLLVLGAATLAVCLVFGFPGVTLADVPRLTVRYPLVSVWFHLMGPVWPCTWYNEAFYRLVSLLSVVCLGWFLLSLLARENVGPVAALLAAVSLVLAPSVFYASSVLYLETPLLVLTCLALRDVEPILKSEFEETRQTPGWYALLIAGFLKETMVSFIGGVILLRVAARTVILVRERRLTLRKMAEEGLVAFCLLTPVFIYLAFRTSFDYQRPYSPQWGNLFMPSLYAKLAVSLVDQFRVVAVLGALGMIVCAARRQGFRVIAIVFISLCGYVLYFCDNWPQYFGYWRFNLSLFPMFAIFAVSFLAWLWRKNRIAVFGTVILCLGADLIDAPLRLDGDRRWEQVYREEDAARWVAAHRPGQPVLADSVSGAFLEWYFMKTGYFPPRYQAIECDRRLSSLDVLRQALSAAREKGYPVVIHHKPDAAELGKEEQSMAGYEAVQVFPGRYRAIAIYAPRPKSRNESGNQN